MKRTCKKCGVEKEIEEFVKSKNCKNGYSHCCLICYRAYVNKRNRLPENKEKQRLYSSIPEQVEKRRKYESSDEGKKKARERYKKKWRDPKYREKRRAYYRLPDVVAKKKEYDNSEERIKLVKIYNNTKKRKDARKEEKIKYRQSENGKKTEREYKLNNKEKHHYQSKLIREKLSNSYIKHLITKRTNLKSKDITPEMIELKRDLLQFNRLTKELENVINRR